MDAENQKARSMPTMQNVQVGKGMRKNGTYLPCEMCGKEFYVQPNQTKRGKGRFCGVECKSKYVGSLFAGSNSYRWGSGEYEGKDGYVYIRMPGHPRAINNYVKRATLVLEKELGRFLPPGAMAHHKNEIKNDDRPENLEEKTRDAHNKLHGALIKGITTEIEIACEHCGKIFKNYASNKRRFCSQSCSAKTNKNRLGTGKNGKF